jgi:putative FmdB family regulatory protein
MPTYEYECPKCPRVFEVRQRITEPALETCDRCGGPIHRLLSAAPFILKGEGWYVTDYPSDARKKATSAESAGSKETTSKESSTAKDGGSAESKPAASSESKSSTDGSGSSPSASPKPAASKPAASS